MRKNRLMRKKSNGLCTDIKGKQGTHYKQETELETKVAELESMQGH